MPYILVREGWAIKYFWFNRHLALEGSQWASALRIRPGMTHFYKCLHTITRGPKSKYRFEMPDSFWPASHLSLHSPLPASKPVYSLSETSISFSPVVTRHELWSFADSIWNIIYTFPFLLSPSGRNIVRHKLIASGGAFKTSWHQSSGFLHSQICLSVS